MLYFLSKASTKDMPHYNGIVNWFRQCSVNHTHTHTTWASYLFYPTLRKISKKTSEAHSLPVFHRTAAPWEYSIIYNTPHNKQNRIRR